MGVPVAWMNACFIEESALITLTQTSYLQLLYHIPKLHCNY